MTDLAGLGCYLAVTGALLALSAMHGRRRVDIWQQRVARLQALKGSR